MSPLIGDVKTWYGVLVLQLLFHRCQGAQFFVYIKDGQPVVCCLACDCFCSYVECPLIFPPSLDPPT